MHLKPFKSRFIRFFIFFKKGKKAHQKDEKADQKR